MPEYRKKLIEVALPLEAINKESAREKSIRHGHPSTLHLWWARRPLATCRAVLFAQMVDDPSSLPEEFPTEEAQEFERQRLFRIIEEFVKWENITNEVVLHKARVEIARSAARNHRISLPHSMTHAEVADALKRYAPPVLDPFTGGSSIPLEAQRLGLEAHASDLNPVAVLINKALIEIPPKFARQAPVNPYAQQSLLGREWYGAQGLADDIRHYGKWMRDEAERRIGYLYPKVILSKEYGGGEATAIAWLWARTVTCPNPACRIHTPLLTTFILSSKKGKETYLVPNVFDSHFDFSISSIPPKNYQNPSKGLKRGVSGIFECISCGTVTTRDYVSEEAKAKRLGLVQTSVVVQTHRGRVYLPSNYASFPPNIPKVNIEGLNAELSPNPRDVWCRNFGLNTPADLFTSRQLLTLATFSDLVQEARNKVFNDAKNAVSSSEKESLNTESTGAGAYADAIATYLGLTVSRCANTLCSLAIWSQSRDQSVNVFSRQGLPMNWDFPEVNPFAGAAGDFAETSTSRQRNVYDRIGGKSEREEQIDAKASDSSRPERERAGGIASDHQAPSQ